MSWWSKDAQRICQHFNFCHITSEDMSVEVEIEDYLDELIAMVDADEDIKDNEDLQRWLIEIKIIRDIEKCNDKNEEIGLISAFKDYLVHICGYKNNLANGYIKKRMTRKMIMER